nr:eukaryotic translation initiation factor 3 subunit D-like [Tanacetum cinerariifolium]
SVFIGKWYVYLSTYQSNKTTYSDSPFDFTTDDVLLNHDDENSFRLVDGKPVPKPKFGPKWRFQNNNRNQLPQRRDEELEAKKRKAEKQRVRRDRLYNANSKLSYNVGEPEELVTFGLVEAYDKAYDRTTPKNERRLERFKNRNFFKVTTTDDHIPRLANEDKAIVFATDSILSTLMCAPRSVYSWDIVIQRVGNKLFFDKRDGLQLDFLSVNETSQEPLPEAKDDINSAHSWFVEAAYINQNFSQLVFVRMERIPAVSVKRIPAVSVKRIPAV